MERSREVVVVVHKRVLTHEECRCKDWLCNFDESEGRIKFFFFHLYYFIPVYSSSCFRMVTSQTLRKPTSNATKQTILMKNQDIFT